MKRPFGEEFLIDAYECNSEKIDDLEYCSGFLEETVNVLGVYQQSPPFCFHSPEIGPKGEDWTSKAGISGWIPLIESGVQLHTLVPKRFVSVDFYTCSIIDEYMKEKLLELVKEYFEPKIVDTQFLERGKNYYEH